MDITRCPICDGELQGTVTAWTSGVVVSVDDGTVSDWGSINDHLGFEDETSRWYCENDHSSAEILDALKNEEVSDEQDTH
ncbi:MAG: hypothetical protein GY759_09100 [Chloroflexi bacterium]|nr:hypothetical protein [Chloroflexota bacterium]